MIADPIFSSFVPDGVAETLRSVGDEFTEAERAFPDESGREAHLSGRVAAALKAKASELFEEVDIQKVDVIAAKLP